MEDRFSSYPSYAIRSLGSIIMKEKQEQTRRQQQIRIPGVYRYVTLGLLLPILVFIGMVLGYNYGIPFGDFSAVIFAGIGSVVGLLIATVVIVKIALYWDKKILRYVRKPGVKRSEKRSRKT